MIISNYIVFPLLLNYNHTLFEVLTTNTLLTTNITVGIKNPHIIKYQLYIKSKRSDVAQSGPQLE